MIEDMKAETYVKLSVTNYFHQPELVNLDVLPIFKRRERAKH